MASLMNDLVNYVDFDKQSLLGRFPTDSSQSSLELASMPVPMFLTLQPLLPLVSASSIAFNPLFWK